MYVNGNDEVSFDTPYKAFSFAVKLNNEVDGEVSICYKCSDNDPRIGEVWFAGFYMVGKFDTFGRWKA